MAGPGRIYQTAERFRRELLQRERKAASEMVHAYGTAWTELNDRITALTKAYYAEPDVSESWLYQTGRLQVLRDQVEQELAQLAKFAATSTTTQQWEAVQAARRHTPELVQAVADWGGIEVSFTRLPTAALTDLVGFQQNGSPLKEIFDSYGPESSRKISNALVNGLATGLNPRTIARQARAAFGGNLARALTVSRTETLRAYREATLRTYQANDDVVEGWIWLCAKQARTCAMCLAMDGTVHKLTERQSDHPCGRCTSIPKLRGAPAPETTTGAEWFAQQDEATQRQVLGQAGYEAYRAGAVTLKDFVGRKRSAAWGTTRYARSLRAILGAEEARKWQGVALAEKRAATIKATPGGPPVASPSPGNSIPSSSRGPDRSEQL